MKKRLLSLLLALLLLAPAAVSCSDNKAEDTSDNEAAESAENSEISDDEAEVEAEEDEGIAPEINDYGGYEFRVWTATNGTDVTFIYADEMTGEAVHDAIYNRDRTVEDLYKIKITGTENDTTAMKNSVVAGDDACDISLIYAAEIFACAKEAYILDFNTIPEMNLTNPWWDQRIASELGIGGKVFTMAGDYTLRSPMCEFVIQFNQKLIDDYNLENPYASVWDGTWTFDKMWDMATVVSNDVNGDGLMDNEDVWGFITEVSAVYYFFTASGLKTLGRGENGELTLNISDENVLNAMTNSLFFALDGNNALCVDDGVFQATKTGGVWTEAYAMFTANQGLFRSSALGDITQYRDMEMDFGILPIPKQTETQDGYYCLVSCWDNPMVIPNTVGDTSRTGNIVEALFWKSHDEVKTAFYETLLSGKLLRDEESVRMLELIIDSKTFDLDWSMSITGVSGILSGIAQTKSDTLSSKLASITKVATKQIEKNNEEFLGDE